VTFSDGAALSRESRRQTDGRTDGRTDVAHFGRHLHMTTTTAYQLHCAVTSASVAIARRATVYNVTRISGCCHYPYCVSRVTVCLQIRLLQDFNVTCVFLGIMFYTVSQKTGPLRLMHNFTNSQHLLIIFWYGETLRPSAE